MDINEKQLLQLMNEVSSPKEMKLSDIPDIDLYMDQVITLFEKHLQDLKRSEDDKILTKAMINNYAKAKIFPPVKGKKYNRNQIILLTLIYNLKQNLSLADIGTVFNPILTNMEKKEEEKLPSLEMLYDVFLKIKSDQLKDFENQFDDLIKNIKEKSSSLEGEYEVTELILLVFTLINRANTAKRMAEKIIDTFLKKENNL